MKKSIKIIKWVLTPIVILGAFFGILFFGYDNKSKNIYVKNTKKK